MRSTGQRWRLAERAWRNMSMPSRADTQPMILRLLKPYQDDEVASFNTDTAAGLCCSKSLLERARRRQVLSPLVPAEAVLRAFPEATRAALLVLAEHTLSSAACGVAAAWAIRDKQLLASTSHAQGELRCFSLCLRRTLGGFAWGPGGDGRRWAAEVRCHAAGRRGPAGLANDAPEVRTDGVQRGLVPAET
ncbi:Hypothetical protein SCF082_LOCUS25697 [Durusdinium trenchii]|uniref:Uncharacterized protein n=1 Tax=Durusdinium trenchii TaxID=1381693 RepID=A0ABP0M434_9DINO